ncbi:MAG: hypothetical protein JWQ57_1638 [Mucilaginibacter sp.]|nr:hypothetical protein [Mucilaginibacter sp.]
MTWLKWEPGVGKYAVGLRNGKYHQHNQPNKKINAYIFCAITKPLAQAH